MSAALRGSPLWKVSPSRSLKLYVSPSSLTVQLSARSGTTPSLRVKLDQTGEEVRQDFSGDDAEVDLGGIEVRNLGDAETELERCRLASVPERRGERSGGERTEQRWPSADGPHSWSPRWRRPG